MVFATITKNVNKKIIIPLKQSKGTRITVKAGAGKKGEGANGGMGGTGEVRSIEFYNLKPFTITAKFVHKAKDGGTTKPATLFGNKIREENRGGRAGYDISCLIKTETNEYAIYCRGGGGGGGGGYKLNVDLLDLVVLGADGGALADGTLNFKAKTLKGGRGQDGGCIYDEDTQIIQGENPINCGPAAIEVESI